MAKVFLDANYLIDALIRKPEKQILNSLENHGIFTSTLSFHIYCYVYKIKMPNERLTSQIEKFQLVDFSEEILGKASQGPTSNLEDNIQLHGAASADCDFFLTEDKKLLALKFFGKTRVVSDLKTA